MCRVIDEFISLYIEIGAKRMYSLKKVLLNTFKLNENRNSATIFAQDSTILHLIKISLPILGLIHSYKQTYGRSDFIRRSVELQTLVWDRRELSFTCLTFIVHQMLSFWVFNYDQVSR